MRTTKEQEKGREEGERRIEEVGKCEGGLGTVRTGQATRGNTSTVMTFDDVEMWALVLNIVVSISAMGWTQRVIGVTPQLAGWTKVLLGSGGVGTMAGEKTITIDTMEMRAVTDMRGPELGRSSAATGGLGDMAAATFLVKKNT